MWCIGKMDAQYRERMYDIIELYGRPYNPLEPVVGMDEKSKQLLESVRMELFGKVRKTDYEYKRHGTRNIFIAVEPLAGRRFVQVTKHRKKADFAHYIKLLADDTYKDATKIHVVLDNLNTHFRKSFVETFGEEEAVRILKRIAFHYTPKHGSWLNIAEIEIGIMDRQCLNRRIATEAKMAKELAIWQEQRNTTKATITWKFSKQDADEKLSKHYT